MLVFIWLKLSSKAWWSYLILVFILKYYSNNSKDIQQLTSYVAFERWTWPRCIKRWWLWMIRCFGLALAETVSSLCALRLQENIGNWWRFCIRCDLKRSYIFTHVSCCIIQPPLFIPLFLCSRSPSLQPRSVIVSLLKVTKQNERRNIDGFWLQN